jgi:colanic acid/amylovoran biosynthesis glycosyltransferase
MKIVIFEGTFKTTVFINRLLVSLSKHNQVFVFGFNENQQKKLENIKYIGLGSNNSKLNFVLRSIQLRKMNLIKQLILFFNLLLKRKESIVKLNIQLAIDRIQPDIVHFQWTSMLKHLSDLTLPSKTKTIFSQRGYQINILPFLNNDHLYFLKKIFKKIDGFHSVSNDMKFTSKLIFNTSNKIDHVIYSGINRLNIFPKTNNNFDNEIKIISVGRNNWKKGYRTAINAMINLKSKNIRFHYTIIGVSANEELLYLIKEFNLSKNITFLSNVSQSKVYQIMYESDLFLLSSLSEGIANVCIEAMFCKLPVISTNCSGMPELITDYKTGFLVPTRDYLAISNKIEEILKIDSEIIKQIVNRAYEKVIFQHNEQNMSKNMINLYKKVLSFQ